MSAAPLRKDAYLPSRTTDGHQPGSPTADPERGRRLLETHLDLIQRKIHHLSRHSGLPELEAEELRSWVLLKLIEDDFRILGQWEGRSSFPTFLRVVLVNLMRDYRIHIWGKWRPSAESRRSGPRSVFLERLIIRDGLSMDEAVERFRIEYGASPSPDDLARLAGTLPWRQQRRRVGDEELLHLPVDGQVETRVEARERARAAARLREVLVPLLQALPAEERLLLRGSFFEGLSMATLAPILGRPQRELYKVRERCLRQMRRSLAEAGLGPDQLRSLLGQIQGSLGLEAPLGL